MISLFLFAGVNMADKTKTNLPREKVSGGGLSCLRWTDDSHFPYELFLIGHVSGGSATMKVKQLKPLEKPQQHVQNRAKKDLEQKTPKNKCLCFLKQSWEIIPQKTENKSEMESLKENQTVPA